MTLETWWFIRPVSTTEPNTAREMIRGTNVAARGKCLRQGTSLATRDLASGRKNCGDAEWRAVPDIPEINVLPPRARPGRDDFRVKRQCTNSRHVYAYRHDDHSPEFRRVRAEAVAPVTAHPTAAWTAQPLREAFLRECNRCWSLIEGSGVSSRGCYAHSKPSTLHLWLVVCPKSKKQVPRCEPPLPRF